MSSTADIEKQLDTAREESAVWCAARWVAGALVLLMLLYLAIYSTLYWMSTPEAVAAFNSVLMKKEVYLAVISVLAMIGLFVSARVAYQNYQIRQRKKTDNNFGVWSDSLTDAVATVRNTAPQTPV